MVTLAADHPLTEQNLTFDMELLTIDENMANSTTISIPFMNESNQDKFWEIK